MTSVKHTSSITNKSAYYVSYGLNIQIEIRPKFTPVVQKSLDKIASCEVGKRLIDRINSGKHHVWINKSPNVNLDDTAHSDRAGYNQKGVGTPTEVYLAAKAAKVFDITGACHNMPIFLLLAHELIHAYHNSYGKRAEKNTPCASFDPVLWTEKEEYHTIMGFPSKKKYRHKPKITENAIRRAFGFHERFSHLGLSNHEGWRIEKCSRLIQSRCNQLILQFNPTILPPKLKSLPLRKITHNYDAEIKYFPFTKNIFIETNSQCPLFAATAMHTLKQIVTDKINTPIWINHTFKARAKHNNIHLSLAEVSDPVKLTQAIEKTSAISSLLHHISILR